MLSSAVHKVQGLPPVVPRLLAGRDVNLRILDPASNHVQGTKIKVTRLWKQKVLSSAVHNVQGLSPVVRRLLAGRDVNLRILDPVRLTTVIIPHGCKQFPKI